MTDGSAIERRIAGQPWEAIGRGLQERGWAVLPGLLTSGECSAVSALYDDPGLFRSRVVMRRHGFGEGEYQYFAYPMPAMIADLRGSLYPRVAPIANDWAEKLGTESFPLDHEAFLTRCRSKGQTRPTPLLLRYGPGDYNRLHQDLYGEVHFPLQAAILLSCPGEDFEGGEFVLTEQKPRSQSRPYVVPLDQGDAVVFAVSERPAQGERGYYRLKMRHGVSDIRAGQRHTLGIIFHDAA
jgi:hypothetical protein